MKTIIFTDMDGTLLDHDTYSFEPALKMLAYIKQNDIPLILTTSKTKAEIIIWQKKLGINEPFISENGAAVFFPDGYRNFDLSSYPLIDGFRVALLGKEYDFITSYLETVKDKYNLKGFAQMSVNEVIECTNLSQENALMSKNRDFSEPFVIEDSSLLYLLKKEASIYGLKITQGGRFYHCIGAHQDKGKALQIALSIFRRNGFDAQSIALGDAKNDETMLQMAQIAVQLPNSNGNFIEMDVKNIIRAKFPGPNGWQSSLEEILDIKT